MRGDVRLYFIEKVNQVFSKFYKEVQRIRKITDDKQRAEEAHKAKNKLYNEWNSEIMNAFRQCEKEGELGTWQTVDQGFSDITQEKYEGLNSPYLLLQSIWAETDGKVKSEENKKSSQSSTNIPKQPNYQSTNAYNCSNCYHTKKGKYYYSNSDEENNKFCTENCLKQFSLKKNEKLEKEKEKLEEEIQKIQEKEEKAKNEIKELERLLREDDERKLKQEQEKLQAELDEIKRKKKELIQQKGSKNCSHCQNQLKEDYWINKTTKKSFCSEECYKIFHAPNCDHCRQKILGDTYYADAEKKTGTLCEVCVDKEVSNHKNSNINKDNLNMNIERERESNLAPKNNHLIYWAIGIIGVSLIGLLGFLIIRKK